MILQQIPVTFHITPPPPSLESNFTFFSGYAAKTASAPVKAQPLKLVGMYCCPLRAFPLSCHFEQ